MQPQLATELLQVLRAVKIFSRGSFSFAGKNISISENQSKDKLDSDARTAIVQHLSCELYVNCYCRRFNGVITDSVDDAAPDESFIAALSAANSSREHLDRGWRILRKLPTGHYVVEKRGLTRTLFVGEFISHAEPRGPAEEGCSISVFCPRESRTTLPGFYYALGETITDEQDDRELLRFYWNVQANGVARLMRLLTQRLNRFQLPFRLKVLNSPTAYNRSDAAVLYLNKEFYRVAAELLVDVHRQVHNELDDHTPLFSKRLIPGLGLAEEPGTGESFGQQRCRVLAEAVLNAYDLNLEDEQERLEEVVKAFEVNGLNINLPHLNPGSTEDYEFELP